MASEYVFDPFDDPYSLPEVTVLCAATGCDEYEDLERCTSCTGKFCPYHLIQRYGLGSDDKADVCAGCVREMEADEKWLAEHPDPVEVAA